MIRTFEFNGVQLPVVAERVRRPLFQQEVIWRGYQDVFDQVGYSRLPGKRIIVDARVIEDSVKSARELELELAPLLISDDLCKLELYDRAPMYEMAIVNGVIDYERFLYTGFSEIIFTSPYPFMFGAEKTITTNEFEVTGTYPVEPIIKVSGATGNFLEVFHEGKKLRLDTAVDGKTFIFDCEKKIVTQGELVSAMGALSLNSRWFELKPGMNIITTNPAATIELTYTERWLG